MPRKGCKYHVLVWWVLWLCWWLLFNITVGGIAAIGVVAVGVNIVVVVAVTVAVLLLSIADVYFVSIGRRLMMNSCCCTVRKMHRIVRQLHWHSYIRNLNLLDKSYRRRSPENRKPTHQAGGSEDLNINKLDRRPARSQTHC